jgi:hypothetical protein
LPNADPNLQAVQSDVTSAANTLGDTNPTDIATQEYQTFAAQTDPSYQLALQQANQQGAAEGTEGSGQLRTSYGNLANQRNLQLEGEQQTLMQQALQGTEADQTANLSALTSTQNADVSAESTANQQLDEQQTYQTQLSEQAFTNALQQYEAEQAAQQQSFNQGATLTELGDAGNPATIIAALASEYGLDPTTAASLAQQMGISSTPSATTPATATTPAATTPATT